jgi:EAL domain-containing protein (putative c-di-GMP-specific phosphodiesterase class I)
MTGAIMSMIEQASRMSGTGCHDFNGYTLSSAFQPIYSTAGCRPIGFEALVRASDANGNGVRPADLFAAVAADQVVFLDWACRALHLRNFAAAGPGDMHLFLNVHPRAAVEDVAHPAAMRDLVANYGFTPAQVCTEILENHVDCEDALTEGAAAYRDLGLTLAMDDFGVGRSNFDRIVTLRPDLVKLDRSVLADAVGDAKARRLLPSVVELIHECGSKVVVEGVEDCTEALIALDAGADFVQGNYLSIPRATLEVDPLSERILVELQRLRQDEATRPVPAPRNAAKVAGSLVARLLRSARGLNLSGRTHPSRRSA